MLPSTIRSLVAAGGRSTRTISTTSPVFAKIRRQDGSTVRPGEVKASGSSGQPASPAERPPPPPPPSSTPSSPTGAAGNIPNPQVNQPSSTSSAQEIPASGSPSTSTSGANEASTSEEPFDLKDLPSLRDLETVTETARIAREAKEGEKASGSGQRRTGAGRKQYVSSIERQRRMWMRYGVGGLVVGGLGYGIYQAMNDESGEGQGGLSKIRANMSEMFDVFNKPSFKTLLPDPLPPPHSRPYTLLIDLEGMLVHSSWDRQSGWRTAKRPGADYFLAYLSQFYEIVLFTSQPLYTAAPVAEKLDPYQAYLPYKLFRDSTRTVGGKTVKDLSYLNRDLSKVILLDTNAEHAALQPENAIIIKPWEGKGGDKGLVDLIPFLESIGIYAPTDVRPIIKRYEGKDIPTEYAKIEAENKKAAIQDWERTHPSSVHGAGSGFLTSVFGSVSNPGQTRPKVPMTYLEQKRAQAQAMYQEEQKYWRDHAEEFSKMIEEDKQRQIAEMKGTLWGFLSGNPGGPGAPPDAEKK